LFPDRLSNRTRIGTRDGRCSHVRVRIARRARESGERPSMFPVMSSGRSSPVRSASAASGAPLLRFKDPAAMAYTIMRRQTPVLVRASAAADRTRARSFAEWRRRLPDAHCRRRDVVDPSDRRQHGRDGPTASGARSRSRRGTCRKNPPRPNRAELVPMRSLDARHVRERAFSDISTRLELAAPVRSTQQ
jgi:hypothetical protein